MRGRSGTVQRQGRLYRFAANGTEYAAFIWQNGAQFCGRVEGHSNVPQVTGKTALAVRDALQQWIVGQVAS